MKSTTKEKTLAKAVLVVLLVFLGYLFYIFTPIWLFSVANSNGTAKVISFTDSKIEYSYFNDYKKEEIKLKRKIRKVSYLNKIKNADELEIKYSKYLSNHVIFVGVDNQTPIFLTLVIMCMTIITIWLYLLVLKGKLSLKTLLGVRN